MNKIIKWLLYIKLKNKQTWLLILILCFASLLVMQNIEDKRIHRNFATNYATDSFMYLSQTKKVASLTDTDKMNNPQVEFSYQLFDDVRDDIWRLSYSSDYREMNRLMSLVSMLQIREYYSGAKTDQEINDSIKPIWSNVAEGIPFEAIDFAVKMKGEGSVPINLYLLMTKYHHYLYENNLNMVFNDELSNISFIYSYLDVVLPMVTIALSLFLAYNTINAPMQDGKIKLLISSGINRKKFYFSVWISNLIQIVIIIITPLLLMNGLISLNGSDVRLDYPMVILSEPLTKIEEIPNYYDLAKETGRLSELYPNSLGRIPPLNDYFAYGGDVHSRTEIVPFYQFAILALYLALLFISFLSAFTIFISTLIRNSIISLMISGSTFLIGYLLTVNLTKMDYMNWSPFTMFNPVRIIEGIYNTTFISSASILSISTFILLLLGSKLFELKSI